MRPDNWGAAPQIFGADIALDLVFIFLVAGVAAVAITLILHLVGVASMRFLGRRVVVVLATAVIAVVAAVLRGEIDDLAARGWQNTLNYYCVGEQRSANSIAEYLCRSRFEARRLELPEGVTIAPSSTDVPSGKSPKAPPVWIEGSTTQQPFQTSASFSEYETAPAAYELVSRMLLSRGVASIGHAANDSTNPHYAEANFVLGYASRWGIGDVHINLPQARRFLLRAKEAGFQRAIPAYAVMLRDGLGGPKNAGEAQLILESCQIGVCASLLGLQYSAGVKPDYEKARSYFERAKDLGYLAAYGDLGDLARLGRGEQANRAKAIQLYRLAADQRDGWSTYQLALDLRHGLTGTTSKTKALQLFIEAVRFGEWQAAADASDMLVNAEGVRESTELAVEVLEPASCRPPECIGGDWRATDALASILVQRKAKSPNSRNAEQMAVKAMENGFPNSLGLLTHRLLEGKDGWKKDLKRAALLARPAYDRTSDRKQCPLDSDCGWPMHAKVFASAIQLALADKAIQERKKGEAAELERLYGVAGGSMKRFTVPINCGMAEKFPYHIYIWDAPESAVPTDAQFDWVYKARGCKVPDDVRIAFQKLFKIAKENNVSFQDLCVYALTAAQKEPAPPKQTSEKIATDTGWLWGLWDAITQRVAASSQDDFELTAYPTKYGNHTTAQSVDVTECRGQECAWLNKMR